MKVEKKSRSLREKIVHVKIHLLFKLLFSSMRVELLETEDLRRLAPDDLIKQCRLNYPGVRKLGRCMTISQMCESPAYLSHR